MVFNMKTIKQMTIKMMLHGKTKKLLISMQHKNQMWGKIFPI